MTSTGVAAGFYGGVMDEARVWNRALTAAEILSGRDQEILTAANLLGRWALNEGTGNTASDSTTPAQNGTLTNAPAWTTSDHAPMGPGSCQHAAGSAGVVCRAAAGDCDAAETCTGASVFCPANLKQPNGTACTDGNVCTLSDSCQAGVCTGTAAPRPGEVTDVQFDPDTQKITWTPIAGAPLPITYDVTRALTTQPPTGGAPGSVCVATGTGAAEATDATVPGSGQAFWYLVRGRDACNTGTWGHRAANGVPGLERLVDACP
jgi:hypothetical protein